MPSQTFLTLSGLTAKIRAVIEQSFNHEQYWIVADIVDHSFYAASKWHYFGLVEKQGSSIVAKIKGVAPGGSFDAIRNFEKQTGQKFRSGISVLINVSVTYHSEYGLQLSINDIDASYTLGQMAQQREATIQRLLSECCDFVQLKDGKIHTKNQDLFLPPVIQKIALISSHNARGYEDFKTTIEENKHGYKLSLDIYYSAVQGENNVSLLFNTLLNVFNSGNSYDAVVIVRGGGGDTDFLIFDHFDVARIIAKFPIPVIVGIGHHINETITDLVAHTSAKTPSVAAEFIIAHNKKFEEQIIALGNQISVKSLQAVNKNRDKLFRVKSALTDNSNAVLRTDERKINTQVTAVINKSRQILSKQHNSLEERLARITTRPYVLIANSQRVLGHLNASFINNSRGAIGKQKDTLSKAIQVTKASTDKVLYKKSLQILDCMQRVSGRALVPLSSNTKELANQFERIKSITRDQLAKNGREVASLESICRVMSPVNILKKGFAIVYSGDKILTDGSHIIPDNNVKIRFSQQIIEATVTAKTTTDGNEFDI